MVILRPFFKGAFPMRNLWNTVSTILVWIVVVTAAAMMVFTIVSVNTFNRSDRAIFGLKAFVVLSDSMSKTDFSAGDLVLIKEVDPATLKPGDIITYRSRSVQNFNNNVTHMIRKLTTTPEGEPGFITFGTTTGADDEEIVTYSQIQGKYVRALPKVGTFFTFLKTPRGYVLFILIPFLLLILFQAVTCVRAFRSYKADLQESTAQIPADQSETEITPDE